MEELFDNDKYRMAIDRDKNRAYLKIKGFWRDPSDVPSYLDDWAKTIEGLEAGFTVLSDLTEMKPHSTAVTPIHERAQKLLIARGLDRTAEVMGDAVLIEFQTKEYAERSSMKKREFATFEEAEAWLDEEARATREV